MVMQVNGWLLEHMPNAFSERHVYEATAVDADGYVVAVHGFFGLRKAVRFCIDTLAPIARVDGKVVRVTHR